MKDSDVLDSIDEVLDSLKVPFKEEDHTKDVFDQRLLETDERVKLLSELYQNAVKKNSLLFKEVAELKRVMKLLLDSYFCAHNMISDQLGCDGFTGDNLTFLAERLISKEVQE